ncbi:hypothetical protein EDD86DRAFT_213428 [Gorgonomyces haynaldii]|nr:hypothetical protein EDD86DRAFT_213428 [Gorgonomyces haynaldii]
MDKQRQSAPQQLSAPRSRLLTKSILNTAQPPRRSVLQPRQPPRQFNKKPIPKETPKPVKTTDKEAQIATWRARFKSFVFYFDGIDTPTQEKYIKRIRLSGGRVIQFLGPDLTHIITANPIFDPVRGDENEQKDVVEWARGSQFKLWHHTKLEQVLSLISLDATMSREKAFGPVTHDNKITWQQFTAPYILVEELSGKYKPLVCREYPNDTFPQIYFSGHSNRNVFEPRTSSQEDKGVTTAGEEHPESEGPEDQKIAPSAASGFLACTTAPVIKESLQTQALQRLKSKVVGQKEDSRKRSAETTSKPRKRSKTQAVFGKVFYSLSGYCENCREKYEHYNEHIASPGHRKFAANEANYRSLTSLMAMHRRKQREIKQDDEEEDEDYVDEDSDQHKDDICEAVEASEYPVPAPAESFTPMSPIQDQTLDQMDDPVYVIDADEQSIEEVAESVEEHSIEKVVVSVEEVAESVEEHPQEPEDKESDGQDEPIVEHLQATETLKEVEKETDGKAVSVAQHTMDTNRASGEALVNALSVSLLDPPQTVPHQLSNESVVKMEESTGSSTPVQVFETKMEETSPDSPETPVKVKTSYERLYENVNMNEIVEETDLEDNENENPNALVYDCGPSLKEIQASAMQVSLLHDLKSLVDPSSPKQTALLIPPLVTRAKSITSNASDCSEERSHSLRARMMHSYSGSQ